MSLSEDIKDFGLDLGYSKVGITTAVRFPTYIEEFNTRYEWTSLARPLTCPSIFKA